ncbi:MAG: hypothetical protein K8W52_45195 [Deltaproteobacteria bacterium]|nr:hypothetical protein [Deltaproteobacteria bacterium]
MIRRIIVMLVIAIASRAARADGIAVGLFAPSSPFAGTAARVEFANRLARAVGAAVGKPGIGRVYGKASDFASAFKKGEVQVAVVDATYLAAIGGGNVVAVGARSGDTSVGWVLVARGAASVLELRGKTVLVPSVGGRESEFVRNALYGGELAKDFFRAIEAAPDAASALTSLGLGKADAAVVPAGVSPPSGTQVIATFAPVSLPVVVVTGVDDATRAKIVAAVVAFEGDAAIGGFRAGGADGVKALARRFAPGERRGPMALPDVRIGLGELLAGRGFAIPRADLKTLIAPAE